MSGNIRLDPADKPVNYRLTFYIGSFGDDPSGDMDSSMPFIPLHVGDYIKHGEPEGIPFLDEDFRTDQVLQVSAVRHRFQDFGTHISQYIDVCLIIVPKIEAFW
jgi:hypothetical protein